MLGGVARVGGFAAFTAMGDWREKGAIGFDHEAVGRGGSGGGLGFGGVLEGDDAGEGDEVAEFEELRGFGGRFAEAVKDGAQFAGVVAEGFEGVIPGVALVDDDVQAKFDGEIELLLEDGGLD